MFPLHTKKNALHWCKMNYGQYKNGFIFLFIFVSFVPLAFGMTSSDVNTNDDDVEGGVIIPETLCQFSCEMSNGDTYTLGVRVDLVIDNTLTADQCVYNVDEYAGINDASLQIVDSYDAQDVSLDARAGNLGEGYDLDTYRVRSYSIPNVIEHLFGLEDETIIAVANAVLYPYSFDLVLYPLIYNSVLTFVEEIISGGTKVTAQYNYEINGCALNKSIEVEYACSGSTPEEAWAVCSIYDGGNLQKQVYKGCTTADCDTVVTAGSDDVYGPDEVIVIT